MQTTQREVLINTYEDVIQLSDLLGHKSIINDVFDSFHKGKELKDLTDKEIVELINWNIKSLLSLKA